MKLKGTEHDQLSDQELLIHLQHEKKKKILELISSIHQFIPDMKHILETLDLRG